MYVRIYEKTTTTKKNNKKQTKQNKKKTYFNFKTTSLFWKSQLLSGNDAIYFNVANHSFLKESSRPLLSVFLAVI